MITAAVDFICDIQKAHQVKLIDDTKTLIFTQDYVVGTIVDLLSFVYVYQKTKRPTGKQSYQAKTN